jgi:hypothetical protein
MDEWREKGTLGVVDALGRNQAAEIRQQLAKCDASLR